MPWNYYKLRRLSLLQSAMDSYYKLRQLFYHKLRHGLLQIATGITKCDDYYKLRQYNYYYYYYYYYYYLNLLYNNYGHLTANHIRMKGQKGKAQSVHSYYQENKILWKLCVIFRVFPCLTGMCFYQELF